MDTSTQRKTSRVRWFFRQVGVGFCIVLTACAGANANTSGASSDGASSNASSGASSADSSGSQHSSDSSANSANSSQNSGQSSAQSSASTNASLDGTSGSTDNASTEASSAGTSRGSSDGTSNGNADPAAGDAHVSAVVAGSVLLLSTVVGIGFAIYGSVRAMEEPQHPGSARATAMYLSAQTHQLEQDLALGAGPVLDDLAAAAGVPSQDRPRFGKVMRAHRAELLALADRGQLTPDRALQFLHRVGELTWADPVLNVSAQRALALADGDAG